MNNKTNLQFTELTPDDIATHEDLYIDILVANEHRPSGIYHLIYNLYAIAELQKANDLFVKMFK